MIESAEDLERRARLISHVWTILSVLTLFLVGLLVSLIFVAHTQADLRIEIVDLKDQVVSNRDETLRNREIGYGNRAIACQQLVMSGAKDLPAVCFTPEVAQHYQPPPGVNILPQRGQ